MVTGWTQRIVAAPHSLTTVGGVLGLAAFGQAIARTVTQLFAGVRVVASGDALLTPGVTRRLISEFARIRPPAAPPPTLANLTPRETEVLRLVAEGLSNTEIAARLVVTEDTIKTHVSRLLAKLGLRDRTQAVITAYESGLVVPARKR